MAISAVAEVGLVTLVLKMVMPAPLRLAWERPSRKAVCSPVSESVSWLPVVPVAGETETSFGAAASPGSTRNERGAKATACSASVVTCTSRYPVAAPAAI